VSSGACTTVAELRRITARNLGLSPAECRLVLSREGRELNARLRLEDYGVRHVRCLQVQLCPRLRGGSSGLFREVPEHVFVEILARIPLSERDPYIVRATCKMARNVYGNPHHDLWHRLLVTAGVTPGAPQQTPEDRARQARRQCNEHLRAPLLAALPQNKVAAFRQSGFQRLDLSHCSSLKSLPEGIGNCTALQKLVLYGCMNLQSVPESVWQLPLTKFDVGQCTKLDVNATMGMIVQSFPGLTELGLAGLKMEALPEGIGQCTALQTLVLNSCISLKSLPESKFCLRSSE